MSCHNAYPAIPEGYETPGSEPVYSGALPEGIDCQRCHGPGSDHVRTAGRASIVNPAKLSLERRMEVCMQCHLETTSFPLPNSVRRFDRGPYSFRPGEPLSAFLLIFDNAPAAGRENKFQIVSSAYRLRKSRCFLESKGALQCITCHNPHDIPHGPTAAEHYNGVCRQCHAVINAANHPRAENCIGCHMPKRRTEDVVHAIMTDHLITRRPAANLLAELPERHGKDAQYHGEVVPYGDADELYTAVAQVAAKSNLDAGIAPLEAAIAHRKPAQAGSYIELGDAYCNTNQFSKAIEPYQQALAREPGSVLILRRLSNAFRGSGQQQQALDTLVHATQLDPLDEKAWYDLGLLQSDAGRKQEAIASLRKAIELDPDFPDAENSLGAILAETGQFDLAEMAFRAALRIAPTLAAAHANLANLLAPRGNLNEAVWHYDRASAKAVDQFNYGIALARMDHLADAQTHIEAALKHDPNLAVAHDVLGGLLENRGQVDRALVEYREAVRLRPNFGKAHLDLGAVLATRGDRPGAAEEFRKAASDPDPEIRRQAALALQSISH
jgi:tetratricopeptide (TPR) repeat protein